MHSSGITTCIRFYSLQASLVVVIRQLPDNQYRNSGRYWNQSLPNAVATALAWQSNLSNLIFLPMCHGRSELRIGIRLIRTHQQRWGIYREEH